MESVQHITLNKGLFLDRVTKRFGSVIAVDRVSLSVENREFLAIVGPTGCGKTSLLRLIAGFEKIDEGHIYIHGQCVDDLQPVNRGVRMVFENNALWPHMRVFDKNLPSNLSFGMKIRRYMPANIESTVDIIAHRLGIGKQLYQRKPEQLSAGQKQVVGIGRAMTIRPKILLLDEPLAHVDPQHRLSLRRELADYHNKMGTITLYVSHNLPEAFSLADRVAIMQDGKIIQVDNPSKLRSQPVNDFVKDFLACFEM